MPDQMDDLIGGILAAAQRIRQEEFFKVLHELGLDPEDMAQKVTNPREGTLSALPVFTQWITENRDEDNCYEKLSNRELVDLLAFAVELDKTASLFRKELAIYLFTERLRMARAGEPVPLSTGG